MSFKVGLLNGVVSISFLSLMACAPNTSSSQSKSGLGVSTQSAALVCSSQTIRGTGVVYNESFDGLHFSNTSFQQRVGDFVSATLNPAELGTVSGVKSASGNFISLAGKLSFDSSGGFNASQSSLEILIYDSRVGQIGSDGMPLTAYPVSFTSAFSGQMDRTRQSFSVVFQDAYGSITLSGTYTGTQVAGRVDFVNTKAFDSSSPRSGVLGAFNIPACSLF